MVSSNPTDLTSEIAYLWPREWFALLLLIGVLSFFGFFSLLSRDSSSEGSLESSSISQFSMITIYLEGAVSKQGAIQVPLGTRLQDLLRLVAFEEEADLDSLQKKRKLKEGERIAVPFQE